MKNFYGWKLNCENGLIKNSDSVLNASELKYVSRHDGKGPGNHWINVNQSMGAASDRGGFHVNYDSAAHRDEDYQLICGLMES